MSTATLIAAFVSALGSLGVLVYVIKAMSAAYKAADKAKDMLLVAGAEVSTLSTRLAESQTAFVSAQTAIKTLQDELTREREARIKTRSELNALLVKVCDKASPGLIDDALRAELLSLKSLSPTATAPATPSSGSGEAVHGTITTPPNS